MNAHCCLACYHLLLQQCQLHHQHRTLSALQLSIVAAVSNQAEWEANSCRQHPLLWLQLITAAGEEGHCRANHAFIPLT